MALTRRTVRFLWRFWVSRPDSIGQRLRMHMRLRQFLRACAWHFFEWEPLVTPRPRPRPEVTLDLRADVEGLQAEIARLPPPGKPRTR